MQEEGEQEESSLISVRSRRSRAKRRPRPQQPEQAPDSAQPLAKAAAAAAHDQAPDTAGSHMPQHVPKRARVEPVQAPGRTGAEVLQQASATRPVQAFIPIGTPQRLSTPEAAEIRRDMTNQSAPGTQHDFHASGSQTPQLASQQRSSPLLTPGQQRSLLTSESLCHPACFYLRGCLELACSVSGNKCQSLPDGQCPSCVAHAVRHFARCQRRGVSVKPAWQGFAVGS